VDQLTYCCQVLTARQTEISSQEYAALLKALSAFLDTIPGQNEAISKSLYFTMMQYIELAFKIDPGLNTADGLVDTLKDQVQWFYSQSINSENQAILKKVFDQNIGKAKSLYDYEFGGTHREILQNNGVLMIIDRATEQRWFMRGYATYTQQKNQDLLTIYWTNSRKETVPINFVFKDNQDRDYLGVLVQVMQHVPESLFIKLSKFIYYSKENKNILGEYWSGDKSIEVFKDPAPSTIRG